ncbi:MAG: hypothetical protein ETSY1_10205 [Candidatus Entotheonella factor]|uniref:Uncharacterized protein n=1 Tax=Entotheonella factor TaxID=1429438 RepID=W4LRM3_ENTF1|nr:MAG: hypothetical protein ETSY1_10205 [Candidatus Entotheonella factor]
MLAELSEQNATGEIARIYTEIRELCAVPYVSSLQRHLATRTGWLEWAWAIVRPVFVDGSAQTQAWQLATALDIQPLPSLSRSALRLLGVDAVGEQAIRDICDSFIRVSPTNLMLSGLLRQVLEGQLPSGPERSNDNWTPPLSLPALPPLVHPEDLTADQRAVLLQFGTEVDGQPFVPGLYRMLAHWPAYLAHLATVLVPRFEDAETTACCQSLLQRLDAAIPDLFASLPAQDVCPPAPPRAEYGAVLEVLNRYRKTSPEMVVLGTLIRDALPSQ